MISLNIVGFQIQDENKFLVIVKQIYKIDFLETPS